MKKKGKTVCQIIRFRGKIEAFFVSIDEFDTSNILLGICNFDDSCAALVT